MKKILLIVISMFIFKMAATAQDIIVLKDGRTLQSKVMEVGENDVKYKKWDNENGPTYTMSISKISAINYQNGTKDSFANYIQKESDIAQSINNAGNNVSTTITKSGSNISKSIDNSVILQQQKMLNAGYTMKTLGGVIGLGSVVGGIIIGIYTEAYWLCGVLPVTGGLIWGILDVAGDNKISAANKINITYLYQYNINENLAINVCSMDNPYYESNFLGAGISIQF